MFTSMNAHAYENAYCRWLPDGTHGATDVSKVLAERPSPAMFGTRPWRQCLRHFHTTLRCSTP